MAYTDDAAHHGPTSFFTRYIWSQDHKVIAVQYTLVAISVGLVGVVLSNLMRLQLGFPGHFTFIDANRYYQFVTMHGMIMVIYLLTALFLGGRALREGALHAAGRVAAATGAKLICETFAARIQRGAGRVAVERLPYFGEMAADFIKDYDTIVFAGAEPPVSFFAYPGKPSWLSPDGAKLVRLATPREDAETALTALADALGAPAEPAGIATPGTPPVEPGPLNPTNLAAVVAKLLPENAIVSDESATLGGACFMFSAGSKRHDWLALTGGAIGQGLPLAVGCAVACPDRKVVALQADGSGMYTVQALWTMAREKLDVTTIILNNSSYAILNIELRRVGVANPGPKALSMLDLSNPSLDWVALAKGMGVPGVRVTTSEALYDALSEALAAKGPRLIEAMFV